MRDANWIARRPKSQSWTSDIVLGITPPLGEQWHCLPCRFRAGSSAEITPNQPRPTVTISAESRGKQGPASTRCPAASNCKSKGHLIDADRSHTHHHYSDLRDPRAASTSRGFCSALSAPSLSLSKCPVVERAKRDATRHWPRPQSRGNSPAQYVRPRCHDQAIITRRLATCRPASPASLGARNRRAGDLDADVEYCPPLRTWAVGRVIRDTLDTLQHRGNSRTFGGMRSTRASCMMNP